MPSRVDQPDVLGKSLLGLQREGALMLLLVRHGQPGPAATADESLKDFLGHPLTPLGLEQARCLAPRLAQLPLSHLYCSNMARAYQTAKATHELRPDVPLNIRPDLREVSSWHTAHHPRARKAADRKRFTDEQLTVAGFVSHLRQTHAPGEIVAVVAHGDLNNLLLATLANVPARKYLRLLQDHTSVSVVNLWPDGRLHLAMANCTRHLPMNLLGSKNL